MKPLFSEQEIRGLLLFLPLAAIAVAVLTWVQPRHDPEVTRALEAQAEAREAAEAGRNPFAPEEPRRLELQPFDPNAVTYEALRAMGLTPHEAAGLIRYRTAGKVFRIPEDVAECYTISDSLYAVLKPYITIGPAYRLEPRERQEYRPLRPSDAAERLALEPFRIDTVGVAYLRATGLLTKRQAEVFVRWRDLHGIRDREELLECYMVDDSLAARLDPYIIYPERVPHPVEEPIELNRADSAELCRVVGIGATTAGRIVAYREALGGFVRVEQLAEVKGITEANYEKILKQIWCDSCEIQKIDINFVAPKALEGHPYIGRSALRRLVKTRQLKGGWRTAEEMIEDRIFTREEAARVAPYLVFNE